LLFIMCLNGLRRRPQTNDAKVVLDFVMTYIFDRFGIPKAIISDRDTHFCIVQWKHYYANTM
jgi:hypothetical protein